LLLPAALLLATLLLPALLLPALLLPVLLPLLLTTLLLAALLLSVLLPLLLTTLLLPALLLPALLLAVRVGIGAVAEALAHRLHAPHQVAGLFEGLSVLLRATFRHGASRAIDPFSRPLDRGAYLLLEVLGVFRVPRPDHAL
jgi:hypothetical protein